MIIREPFTTPGGVVDLLDVGLTVMQQCKTLLQQGMRQREAIERRSKSNAEPIFVDVHYR